MTLHCSVPQGDGLSGRLRAIGSGSASGLRVGPAAATRAVTCQISADTVATPGGTCPGDVIVVRRRSRLAPAHMFFSPQVW